MKNDDSGSGVQRKEVVNMEHRAHVSFLIDKVDTMQKSRLQGPSTFHSVFEGPRFTSNTLRPRSEPRKAVPSLNTVLCPKMEEPQFGRRTGETQAFYFSKDALV